MNKTIEIAVIAAIITHNIDNKAIAGNNGMMWAYERIAHTAELFHTVHAHIADWESYLFSKDSRYPICTDWEDYVVTWCANYLLAGGDNVRH